MDPSRAVRKLRENPRKMIDAAHRGSLLELTEIANMWQEAPQVLSMGVLDVFFRHLDANTTPTNPERAIDRNSTIDRAFMSMVGLTKAGNFLTEHDDFGDAITKAWPGVFKWSAFFFAGRVQNKNAKPEMQKSTLDVISGTWYSLSRSEKARKAMNATKGSIEIATQMWVLEDRGKIPSVIDIPSASAALDTLLRDDTQAALDRVLAAAGGEPDNIVQLSLSRLRTSVNGPGIRDPAKTAIYLDLIGHLSRGQRHPLRHAFLHANTITLCTKVALSASQLLNQGGPPGLLDVMVASFGYLANYLESTEGFTWVTQAIQAGLLTAFVDCSPHFSKVDDEDRDTILTIVRDILPKYLVYRSVILAVDGTIRKLSEAPHNKRIMQSVAWGIWSKFHELALERYMVTIQAKALKGKGATCDNVKCHKVDSKNNFRKCASCSTTLYCSKECQVIAWKEGRHKAMCKMKQRERLEGKLQSISRSDSIFFHHLFTRDARNHLPRLRRLALKDYPGTTKTALVICIDYTVIPPKYSLIPLAKYEESLPDTRGSPNTEARNEALLERARENPGKFTIIQSKIANGEALQIVMTVVTGSFWEDRDNPWIEDENEAAEHGDDSLSGKTVDGVDMMMARMALNSFLRSQGEPETF
ncbi:hypothetical protein Hypma_016492 [Hypsizygus marmoreus]|uniref:MYND-type domain-containing protein n=1 Tax=Hypsizygus marmoreus TaxID=39966 RepID=A0A369IY65_HYPMA|nr:hypothetical protein Hypma_016492 [Hypsizygus marmoreus]